MDVAQADASSSMDAQLRSVSGSGVFMFQSVKADSTFNPTNAANGPIPNSAITLFSFLNLVPPRFFKLW